MTDESMTPSELDAVAAAYSEVANHRRRRARMARKAELELQKRQEAFTIEKALAAITETIAQGYAQAGADAMVEYLTANGMLRSAPRTVVKTVERNKAGLIKAVIEHEVPA